MSASSVGVTDIHTPSANRLQLVFTSYAIEYTCCTHGTPSKRGIHKMIQGKTLANGLLAHRRYDFYGLRRMNVD